VGLEVVELDTEEGGEGVGLAFDLFEEVTLDGAARDNAAVHGARHAHGRDGTCAVLQLPREERGERGVRLEGVAHLIHVALEEGPPHLVDGTACPHGEGTRVDGAPTLGEGDAYEVPAYRLAHPALAEHSPCRILRVGVYVPPS